MWRRGFRYQIFTFYWVYLLFLAIVIGITIVLFSGLYGKANYESENRPFGGSSTTGGNGILYYNYYLDMTPSMFGFAEAENSNFQTLANVLESVNLNRSVSAGEISCYMQSADVTKIEINAFYGLFRGSGIRSNYMPYINAGDEAELADKTDTYMSAVFSGIGETGGAYVNNTETVSIIITDLNFLDDTQLNEDKLTTFSRELSRVTMRGNIGIYGFDSTFSGVFSDMPYDEMAEGAQTLTLPVYFIVASENDTAFENYTKLFEEETGRKGISYTRHFEIKSKAISEAGDIRLDYEQIMRDADPFNLNYDNKFWRGLPENALGLSIVEAENASSITVPIMAVEPSGYYTNISQIEADDLQEIESRVIVSYPVGGDYERCTEEEIVYNVSAYLQNTEETYRLCLRVGLSSNIEIKESREDYIVVDIAMYMQNPKYQVPDWAEMDEPIGILLEQIVRDKKDNYAGIIDEYDKFIGNVILYITYR